MSAYFAGDDENVVPTSRRSKKLSGSSSSLSAAAQKQRDRAGNAFHVSAFSFPASNVQLWNRTPRGPAIVVTAGRQVPTIKMSASVLRDISVQAGLAKTIAAPAPESDATAAFTMELRAQFVASRSPSEEATLEILRVLPAARSRGKSSSNSSSSADGSAPSFDPVWRRWEQAWPVIVPLELRAAPADADAGAPLSLSHEQTCGMLRTAWSELQTHRGLQPAHMMPICAVAMLRDAEGGAPPLLDLHFEAVLPAAALVLTPILKLRIMSTDCSVKLVEQAANEFDGATGFLTLGRTRQAIPLLPTDALAYNRPLVGVWARGMAPGDPRLRATVMRYLHCKMIAPHRVQWPQVRNEKKSRGRRTLLLALFPSAPFDTE